MRLQVLIAPDKFKGTLNAPDAAQAIARGWHAVRPGDQLRLLPITDGGDGFGQVFSSLLDARPQTTRSVDAAHRPCRVTWWWEPKTRTAVIESARVIGLAMLPPGRFHPFELDTFGLGAVIRAALARGPRQIIIGIGGSATNDGGFGMARALGWTFFDRKGKSITRWTELQKLARICPPGPGRKGGAGSPLPAAGPHAVDGAHGVTRPVSRRMPKIIVAVDVQNLLLGPRGATRIYGPQKGLRAGDFIHAERCLRRLATIAAPRAKFQKLAQMPGAGAAGGLGFGLAAFLGAKLEPGFALFAQRSHLARQVRGANLVITGEGAIDHSTVMGKGTGELAAMCHRLKIPCLALAGVVVDSHKLKDSFAETHALIDLTSLKQVRARPAFWLERLAANVAAKW